VRRKHTHSVVSELVSIRGWRALALRAYSQMGPGVALPREEVPWLVGVLGSLPTSSTGPIPLHIARAWGPLRVLVSPKGVRLWRSPGSWPIEGVAITTAEAPHVIDAVAREWS
jgi:hypothetical protein